MFRTKNCGELRIENIGEVVTLSGWVNISRMFGELTFIDIRDRYGITQLVFNGETNATLNDMAKNVGREYVVKATGTVRERSNKNPNRNTGDIEIEVSAFEVLNESKVPPFTIESETDGGEDLRMKYRYLDLRRPNIQENIIFRSKLGIEIRKYLSDKGFLEIETPFLIKSTPEGARDFVVPSRMNPGQFYALPQSPQTFKQLLMVAGFDKYFQIVKCFRDEDLRADRQPEFTQIDCEMSFVTQDQIMDTFEGLTRYLFKNIKGIDFDVFPRMPYSQAMELYGSDKPDLRFDMPFVYLNDLVKNKGFEVFDKVESVIGICATGGANYTRKEIDALIEWVKRPQIGASGLVYVRYNEDGTLKSSVDKFYSEEDLKNWAIAMNAQPGDLMLILAGQLDKTRKQLCELRLEMGQKLGLIKKGDFKPLWVVDFPLLEWDEDSNRFYACHHPFTAPNTEDAHFMKNGTQQELINLRAQAYDMVINGVEIGGGSIRIHDRELQSKNFDLLGFSKEEAQEQFGFLMGAFEFGAPPHGGLAFGFDRLCAVMNGQSSIRDYIAFPKNNQGRDMMIDAPSVIDESQLKELCLSTQSNTAKQ